MAKTRLQIDLKARNLTRPAFTGVMRALTGLKTSAANATRAIGRNFVGVQNQAAALLAVIGGFQGLVRAPAEFSNEMAKVGTLGEEARQRLGEFTDEVRRMGVETGTPLNSLADGLFNVISAGTDASNAINILEESNRLAVAGSADLTSTISGLSVVANSFNVTTTEGFKELSQNLFAAQVIGKTTIEDLSSNVGKLGATFADAGISVTEMFTALADITTVSSNTEEAATSLRSAITAILKPTSQLKAIMTSVGIPLGDAAFKGRTLGEIFTKIGAEAKRLGVPMAQVIGNVRAVTAAVTLGAENGDRYNRALEKQGTFLGELDKSYELMNSQLKSTLDSFGNLIKILGQKFSEGLLVNLQDTLLKATSQLPMLAQNAKLAGQQMRLAFTGALPAIRNFIDLLMVAVEGLQFGVGVISATIDVMGQSLVDAAKTAGIDLGFEFRDDLQLEAKALRNQKKEIRDLQQEYQSLTDTLNKHYAKTKEIRETGMGEAAEAFAVSGIMPDLLMEGVKKQMLERRKSIFFLIEAGKKIQASIEQRVKDLALPGGRSSKQVQEIAESIRGRLSDVFGGANANDPAGVAALKEEIRQTQREIAKLGSQAPPELKKINEGLQELLQEINNNQEATKSWLQIFKEDAKDAWASFKEGVREAIEPTKDLATTFKDLGKRFVQLAEQSLARFFDSVAAGTANAEEAFRNFGRALLSEINKIMAQKTTQAFIQMISAAFSSSAVPVAAPTFTQTVGITPPMSTPLAPYSSGGIVRKPTAALIGEAGMNEAVVPLPNGRSIPVQFQSAQAGGDTIHINIQAMDGQSVERVLTSAAGRRAIEGAVRNAKATRRDLR